MKPRVPILVCGEAERGDDGAALAAVLLLPARAATCVDVRVVGQLGVQDLIDAADEGAGCVVVDAVSGIPAGTLWVRPLADLAARVRRTAPGAASGGVAPAAAGGVAPAAAAAQGIDAAPAAAAAQGIDAAARRSMPVPRSSHELPIDQVVALIEALRGAPPVGTFVGMGGATWDLGSPLSPEVAAMLPALAAAIQEAADDVGSTSHPAEPELDPG